jgi:hypothetical protein
LSRVNAFLQFYFTHAENRGFALVLMWERLVGFQEAPAPRGSYQLAPGLFRRETVPPRLHPLFTVIR